MNIVKQSKGSSSRFLRKRPFFFGKNKTSFHSYLISMIFASWLATYLELIPTGKQLYTFQARPFADIFPIDIRFTLIGIPAFTLFMLLALAKMNFLQRSLFLIMLGLIMVMVEQISGRMGWIVYSEQWQHIYSFFGYPAFILVIFFFFKWCESARGTY
ncbi:CBO0543 family protein [Peribacillus cavernae]|uniref:CBO0543 family protein n=1 Tax=Peribacillus cavernae TaxID=1674310 RepID=UPI0035209BB9